MKQNVTSREYKVMLQKERFIGSQDDLLQKAGEFWNDFKGVIQDIVIDTDGSLNEIEKERTIRFYDTADRRIRKNNYVFRERVDLNTGKREVTLKYRHPDRYISQDRDMTAANVKNGKTKFEEDIKLPFVKLYSFSTKQPISNNKNLNKLNDLGKLYPDFKKRLKSYQKNEPIEVVGDFTAREIVIAGADFQIRNSPKVEAECALIAWYDMQGEKDNPVVVEFSFKYENEKEKYDGETSQRVYDVFGRLKEKLAGWVDPDGQTKTAYVYSRAS
ncbi:MAG: hypothetical protein F6K40_38385 [Okeania sp. SIO3I5]|uniref:hypothetical protein n=1 Tax=Okeania sp. SIO3I5 TaxID=2607805 RepID=UPI0013B9AA8B|nr:hypothetical protein [Okeania sp. SIO3I5]NEQ41741.1 hypothetical protein [Okeania sp. SIO3I5]